MSELSERFPDALTRLGNDVDLMAMMARIVAEDAPILQRQLSTQIISGDWNAVAATTHSLRGLLATFQIDGPVSRLQELESFAKSADGNAVTMLYTSCQPQIEDLIKQVSMS